jgi:hypothetical protein
MFILLNIKALHNFYGTGGGYQKNYGTRAAKVGMENEIKIKL